ncbi:transcriptional regulator [Pseudomonas putida CSV86]|uniref:Transcriptional regulator n=2 Tax=Pseudomonas TaxID=286 RepID=A0A177SHA9_PSEPU|nr:MULTISPECIES: helix-turn-helix domain-containing protein [Pseudomonas]MDG9883587.1 transcriptional regulator [Pseudomonas sp. GD04058]NNJ14861.1 transcriptional regulator [Pseudomonas bharatica CSV86]OAI88212.1 transcriptional regulator [Pseudomonas putida]
MYEYTGCGLNGIFLKNGYKMVETSYGGGVVIEDIDGLHRAIAVDILGQTTPMSGHQFRFLRKEQGLVQSELAALLRVDVQTVANWEKKGLEAVPGPADVAMRACYCASVQVRFGPVVVEPDAKADESAVFEWSDHAWVERAA